MSVRTSSTAAMLLMLVAVLCFFIGDKLTNEAARHIAINPTMTVRLMAGLAVAMLAAVILRAQFSWRGAFLNIVVLRSWAYFFAIYCFATAFTLAPEMTSVYVISFSWPFLLAIMTFVLLRLPQWIFPLVGGVRPPRPQRSKIAYLINALMFVGIVVYYWPRLASQPSFLLTREGLLCVGTALSYALIIALGNSIPENVGRFEKLISALVVSLVGFTLLFLNEMRHGMQWQLMLESGSPLLMAVFAGIFSAGGLLLLTEAMSHGDEEKVAPLDYCVIVVSTVWAIVADKLWPSGFQWTGILMILMGAFVLFFIPGRVKP